MESTMRHDVLEKGRTLTATAIFATALAQAVSVAGCAGHSAESTRAAEARPRDPHALVAEGATLLDVRTQAEYEERHLEGAVLIPVDQVAARMSEVSRERPVVVYCRSGARAERAAAVLRDSGYDVVVLGGIDDW